MVGKIIDALMDSEQQAGYSLTGAACRSKPKDQQIQKEKFPEEFAAAIYSELLIGRLPFKNKFILF